MKPRHASELRLVDAPITIEILGELRRDASISLENSILADVNTAISEVMLYKRNGGNSLVDVTVEAIGRDPLAVKSVSLVTGIHIIQGTGWYVEKSRPPYAFQKDSEKLSEILVKEITDGIDDTGIKAGVIGEIAVGDPLSENDSVILKASAKAQVKTGAALTIHPAMENFARREIPKKVAECLEIIERVGADLGKVYVSHMDYWIPELDYHRSLIDKYGVTLNFDTFRVETNFDYSCWPGHGDPSDKDRVIALLDLLNRGYEKNLMLSHDICFKHHLVKYGGYGYTHLLKNIVPILKFRGVSEKQIRSMLIENPARMFAL